MLFQLFFPEDVVLLHHFSHLRLQLTDHLEVRGGVAHFLCVLHQFLYVLLSFLHDFSLGLDLRLQVLDFVVFFLDDSLEVHHPFECDLVRFLALVVLDGPLESFYHLVRVLQLHVLRLDADRMPILIAFALQLVLRSLAQLLV